MGYRVPEYARPIERVKRCTGTARSCRKVIDPEILLSA
jgi:hypothetical protein